MEDTTFNPISGDQVPFKDMNESEPILESITTQSNKDKVENKEVRLEKKVNVLGRYIIILGAILIFILIALVLVLAMLAKSPGLNPSPTNTPSPSPTPYTLDTNNLPKEVVDRVNSLEERVKNLDLEESELALPRFDWKLEY